MSIFVLVLSLFGLFANYDAVLQDAEARYAEKSFAQAHQLYAELAKQTLPPAQRRWIELRLADTAWRADAANPSPDDTARTAAVAAVEELIRKTAADHDRLWAEAEESLGDYYATHPRIVNPDMARQYYNAALDWWAGSDDLPLARRRYLDLVWRIVKPRWSGGEEEPSQAGAEVLANAASIAQNAGDRAHARYLLATLLLRSDARGAERAVELLQQVIADGRTAWLDDALFVYAQMLGTRGEPVVLANGQPGFRPNYAKALAAYQRILSEYKLGETQYWPQARSFAQRITNVDLDVTPPGTFLPQSEQELVVSSRNVKEIELTISAVDLVNDVTGKSGADLRSLAIAIRADGHPVVRRWTVASGDAGDYAPIVQHVRLSPILAPGAYLVSARAGSKSLRTIVLVSDVAIVTHSAGKRMDVFVTNVLTGEPVADARVAVRASTDAGEVASQRAVTNANGLATVEVAPGTAGTTIVTANAGAARQAYHSAYLYRGSAGDEPEWRVYAFTDRPAYRPAETVQWKMIARVRADESWTTPAGQTLAYDITGPRGEKVASGDARLNEFGTFNASLPLTTTMALGEYVLHLRVGRSSDDVALAALFRLEEYKLPEFRVSVTTTDAANKRALYRLGDTIDATIEATYYFGGSVANATVEVVVHENPLYRSWHPYRDYAWYYEDDDRENTYDGGPIVKRETLRTDANGRAVVHIETPHDTNERRYTIEARVVDASRREVSGSGVVRVMKQRYAVYATPRHYIHRINEHATVDFKAIDANEQPVVTTGTVIVERRTWSRTDRRYDVQEIATTKVTTDANGEASYTFTPATEGYYSVRWTSEDRDGAAPLRPSDLVTAETMLFAARQSSTSLGYNFTGGIEIIVDRETVKAGETTPVMIVTPSSGRWVLFTTAGDDIFDTRVVHLDGTVKLVELAIDDRHTPNFSITASSMFDRVLASDTKDVVVPPLAHFLDISVAPDRADYEPRQKGTVTIAARDADGKPVRAEVAVSVTDESVTAIGQDPAGDPRQTFFGERRDANVQVASSVQSQPYLRYVVDKDGQLVDDRVLPSRPENAVDALSDSGLNFYSKSAGGIEAGVVGGVVGGAVASPAPPPPPPMMAPQARRDAVSESITVTAAAPKVQTSMQVAAAAVDVVVRHDFRSTAFWAPAIITGADGTAQVTFDYPEALTTWRATARAATSGSAFGIGSATTRTAMPLLVRLEAPRFFVAVDRATVSAVINNNTDAAMSVTPSIEAEGLTLRSAAKQAAITVPPHGDARAEWDVAAEHAGDAKLRVRATSADRGDAMEKPFVVYEHGIDKLIARSGKVRGDDAVISLALPAERRNTALTVRIAPSLAVTMLDALPYLINFPYGCTEQTMSRFLPAAIVARTLTKNGLQPRDIEGRMFGGIEHAPKDAPNNLAQLDAVTAASMTRLYDFQHGDGGWGWWKNGGSDAWMTAYVVWGFSIAREGGLDVRASVVSRATEWLDRQLVQQENQWDQETWLLHAIAAWRHAAPNAMEQKAFDDVWSHRERLSAYSRALLALAAHDFGATERAKILIRNLEDGVKVDRSPDESRVAATGNRSTAETIGTAHWGADGSWWRWWESPVETTGFALQALVAIDPQNRLVEPVMNWLVKNRRGAQWNNTRDTAIALIGLNDYLRTSGELGGDVSYELTVNGRAIASKTIAARDVLNAPAAFAIDASLIRDNNEIRIHRRGGALYFAAEARFVSLEEPVKAAGNELFVRREYVRLAPKPTLLKGVVYEKVPLEDGATIDSGDRVEVVVTIETKNDYEYLLFEDLKPAGFEAVALQSGESLLASELRDDSVTRSPASDPTRVRRAAGADVTFRSASVYQELRDRKVAMFIDHLAQGVWQIRYPLRAETPGTFHALPLLGHAMYVPEIRANGEEVRVTVK